ncbi:DNA cytosine methyltransferase [Bradyrhizobium symbiodeficiens]|uniref:DNA cytosine methyltransferase n=1 Tax=Bradyrhizobium symbiodeficiens TaxID=1404367 RepID=UPI001FCE701C|nr:DNA cytosine methyltransferase [Bradyrhizobium symbiodeficiens]
MGLARAGVKHELVVERDNETIATLLENKRRGVEYMRDWTIEGCDTRDIDFTRYQGLDLVAGGPPCQPFSVGGRHLGRKDPRNMWPEAIRAVREVCPRAFVFENVRGLLRPSFSTYLEYLTRQLGSPHVVRKPGESWCTHSARLRRHVEQGGRPEYRVIVRGVNAADLGAPQKRHRALIIGVEANAGELWDAAIPTHSLEALAWSKHVAFDYWIRHATRRIRLPSSTAEARAVEKIRLSSIVPQRKPWVTTRDALSGLPPAAAEWDPSGHWQHLGARAYEKHTGSVWDEPAKALKAGNHGVPGGENMIALGKGRVRYFTIREMARLQGLPDEFIVSGSWKAATRQLGNAVPTAVGARVGNELKAILAGG